MLKQVRIQADGTVIYADRIVKLTKQESQAGPDRVQWILTPDAAGK